MDTGMTWAALFDIAVEAMKSANPALRDDILRTAGTDANAIAAAIATVGEEVAYQNTLAAKARLLQTAEGEDLDELLWGWFRLERHDANPALAVLTFQRSGAGVPGTIGTDLTFRRNGAAFRLDEALSFSASDLSLTAVARCVVAGPEGNVSAGTWEPSAPLFDPTLMVTSSEPAAGGTPRESDESYRSRAVSYWLVARRGTLDAVEYGAKTVNGVHMAAVEEADLTNGPSGPVLARWVEAAVCDASGASNAAMSSAVTQALRSWRPCGTYVAVLAAQTISQSIEATCAWRAGADTVSANQRVKRAIVAYVNGLRIGEVLDPGSIREVIRRDPDVAVNPSPSVILPAGAVVPTRSQVIRTGEPLVKVNGR